MPSFDARIRRLEHQWLPPAPPGPPWTADEQADLDVLAACLGVDVGALPAWPGAQPCHALQGRLGHLEHCLQVLCGAIEVHAAAARVSPREYSEDEEAIVEAIAALDAKRGGGWSYAWANGREQPYRPEQYHVHALPGVVPWWQLPQRCADVPGVAGKVWSIECTVRLYSPWRGSPSPAWVRDIVAT